MTTTDQAPDLAAVKGRQQQAWASGDFAAVGATLVCRSGGRIGMANWTPEGFIGEMFKVTGRHVPPPAGLASLDVIGQLRLEADLLDLARRHNTAADGSLRVPAAYLEVVATKQ